MDSVEGSGSPGAADDQRPQQDTFPQVALHSGKCREDQLTHSLRCSENTCHPGSDVGPRPDQQLHIRCVSKSLRAATPSGP